MLLKTSFSMVTYNGMNPCDANNIVSTSAQPNLKLLHHGTAYLCCRLIRVGSDCFGQHHTPASPVADINTAGAGATLY